MDDPQPPSDDDSEWVVRAGAPEFPADIIAAATGSHGSLAQNLTALRALSQPFLSTPSPAAADRWVESGGERPPSQSAGS